jgi:hypothetical protein
MRGAGLGVHGVGGPPPALPQSGPDAPRAGQRGGGSGNGRVWGAELMARGDAPPAPRPCLRPGQTEHARVSQLAGPADRRDWNEGCRLGLLDLADELPAPTPATIWAGQVPHRSARWRVGRIAGVGVRADGAGRSAPSPSPLPQSRADGTRAGHPIGRSGGGGSGDGRVWGAGLMARADPPAVPSSCIRPGQTEHARVTQLAGQADRRDWNEGC